MPSTAASRPSAPLIRWVASSGSARLTPSTCIVAPPALSAVAQPAAAGVERDVADLVVDAQDAAARPPRRAARPRPTRLVLGLADVPQQTEPLPRVASPELTESDGMPAATAALMDGASASGSGTEMASALGRLATAASISWLIRTMSKLRRGLVLEPDAELSRGVARTVRHDGPEGVGRLAVADHDDADVAAAFGAGRGRADFPTAPLAATAQDAAATVSSSPALRTIFTRP